MNRLTERTTKGYAYYPECFKPPCNGDGCKKELCEFSEEACSRLADYEDTGLTPESIGQLQEMYMEKCRELAEERKKHEWISISNTTKIPDERKTYLVTYMTQTGKKYVRTAECSYSGTTPRHVDFSKKIKGEVIAWKPLPSPYIQEETE